MTYDQLVQSLHDLGLSEDDYKATLMMPLVQVAWADTKVQAPEREAILEHARKLGLSADGVRTVERWLDNDPGVEAAHRTQELLRELARMQRVSLVEMDEVVRLSEEVAKSAGGFFGLFSIDKREREVLREIEGNLSASSIDFTAGSWDEELALA